jgi:ribosomal protein L37AE/L43A
MIFYLNLTMEVIRQDLENCYFYNDNTQFAKNSLNSMLLEYFDPYIKVCPHCDGATQGFQLSKKYWQCEHCEEVFCLDMVTLETKPVIAEKFFIPAKYAFFDGTLLVKAFKSIAWPYCTFFCKKCHKTHIVKGYMEHNCLVYECQDCGDKTDGRALDYEFYTRDEDKD